MKNFNLLQESAVIRNFIGEKNEQNTKDLNETDIRNFESLIKDI